MKILVLHNSESLLNARRSILDYIFCFERYAPEHQYAYHRIMLPPTATLMSTAWDAIIFDSTALGIVSIRPRERFHHIRERWSFLCSSPAVKLVFPQDDASHSALLDLWFNWMNVDVVYSVRPELKEKLYPLTSSRAQFLSTVAGFVDDATVAELAKFSKPFETRKFTFGQRVTMYPAWGGRFAQRKGVAAARIAEECQRRGISANISTDPSDVLLGDKWYDFLGDCKFVVGAEGGHGIWDPYGAIQDSVNDYTARHPEATFAEIESFCFPGLDGRDMFPGFAPRVLEAAMLGCGQVLIEGNYRGFIKPGEHYIPLKADFSNMDEVFAAITDTDCVRAMIAAAERDLVQSPRFRFSTLVSEVIEFIRVRIGAQDTPQIRDSSSALTPSDKMRHFKELETALYGVGITAERLYEPHLTTWVRRELGGQITDPTLRHTMGLDDEANSIRRTSVSPHYKTPADKMAEVLDAMGYHVEDFEEVAIALARNRPGRVDELIGHTVGLIRDGKGDVLRNAIGILEEGGEVLQDAINLICTGNGETLREFIAFLRDNAEREANTENRAVLASQLLPIIQHSPVRRLLLRILVKLHI